MSATRPDPVVLVVLAVACAVGIVWAFYTGGQQIGSLDRCEQLVANVDPDDDCPQPVRTVAP